MRVLVVDDHEDTVEVFATFLSFWGHEVRTVRDAVLVVPQALEFLPDVILLDLGMPVLDGYEIARRLRQDESMAEVLLIAVTGYGRREDVERAYAAGFDVHLLKPVDPQQLRALLKESPPPRPRVGAGPPAKRRPASPAC